ncbi:MULTISPECIES: helix-turn-helix domain-containing protein [Enterobacterales]|uniref:helix-turn-helix domain-containing protein n=1 Tax=Enterobacterales TaxID=91347 RepID=UPI002225C99C|nr:MULTISPECIES: helix-turn-helix domain-containing protein [Enterobacterales]MCW2481177.1 helix-turn-helix domain-containing protein [Candidatus Symbiopectobacterium sp. NZEC135]MDY4335683.1 helix-turn-helix domain-containing protein [Pectobacterium brasiliense]
MKNIPPIVDISSDDAPLVSTNNLAKRLNCKPQTIRKWICQDKLPEGLPRPKTRNGRHHWRKCDIDDYIKNFFSTDRDEL